MSSDGHIKKANTLYTSSPLYLDGTQLNQVASYKYLGVTIQICHGSPTLCNKTRKLVGMIYRRFYQHSDRHTLLKLYLTIIRPNLEYASPVWDPYHKTEIEAMESVQRFALKMCLKSWNTDYNHLLLEARLPSLKARHAALNLSQINKVTHYPDAPITKREDPTVTEVLIQTLCTTC